MGNDEEDHSDSYNNTIFTFNVVLAAIITSLGIIGNILVLLLLHNWESQQSTKGLLKTICFMFL